MHNKFSPLDVLIGLCVALLALVPCTDAAQRRRVLQVTRQGDVVPCSMLLNSAVAVESDGTFEIQNSMKDTSIALMKFATQGRTAPIARRRLSSGASATLHPAAAIVGSGSLFNGKGSSEIALSPAVSIGNEICYMAKASEGNTDANLLAGTCKMACSVLEPGLVSLSYHQTQLGNLPFVFIGVNQQQWKDCQDIVYPEKRTALGWMCRNMAEVQLETGASAPAESAAPRAALATSLAAACALLAAALIL